MIEYTYRCDAPPSHDDEVDDEGEPRKTCSGQAVTSSEPPTLPVGMLSVREEHGDEYLEMHFCDWNCLFRYCATVPPGDRVEQL